MILSDAIQRVLTHHVSVKPCVETPSAITVKRLMVIALLLNRKTILSGSALNEQRLTRITVTHFQY